MNNDNDETIISERTGNVSNHIYKLKVRFFSSPRVNEYLSRLKICTFAILFFSALQIVIWIELDFIHINYRNSLCVFSANIFVIIENLINLIKLCIFPRIIDERIIQKIKCVFFFTLLSFFVNIFQTLLTLFGAYLNYFISNYLF